MKQEKFKEWLINLEDHFKKSYEETNNILDNLTSDLFRQVNDRLENTSWDELYLWLEEQQQKIKGFDKLSSTMRGGYKQCRAKMWSLNRKYKEDI